jgi:microcystin-dependent protein
VSAEVGTPGQLLAVIEATVPTPPDTVKLATIDSAYVTGAPQVIFDGEAIATTNGFQVLGGYSPRPNDRVVMLRMGASWVILGNIGGRIDALPVGATTHFFGTVAPNGWLFCDGATYNVADYPDLGAVMGAAGSTFTVPDMRDRFVVSRGTVHATIGDAGGNATTTLTVAQLPAHHHNAHDGGAFAESSATGYLGGAGTELVINNGNTADTGSGTAIDMHPPYYVMSTLIKF